MRHVLWPAQRATQHPVRVNNIAAQIQIFVQVIKHALIMCVKQIALVAARIVRIQPKCVTRPPMNVGQTAVVIHVIRPQMAAIINASIFLEVLLLLNVNCHVL
jgi:hypothetical protein